MTKLRVGLIGCGRMGSHVARQCHSLDDADVVAAFDIKPEAAAKIAEELGATAYDSQDEFFLAVDAVIIATPNDCHAPYAVEAANRGKHIFCEKPMALSVADCDAMIDAADKAGVKFMVGQVLRLIGVFWESAKTVRSGELGAPFGMSVTRLSGLWTDTSWRTTRRQAGGIVYEVHVHELDFMRHIMGEAVSVYANMGHFSPAVVEYEDAAFIQIRYASGGMGCLHCGASSSISTYKMMIQCEKGTLVNGGFGSSIEYSLFGQEKKTIESSDIQKEEPYREEVRSWVESITKETPMVYDARDGRAAIELAEAAYLSAETGDVVHLPLRG